MCGVALDNVINKDTTLVARDYITRHTSQQLCIGKFALVLTLLKKI